MTKRAVTNDDIRDLMDKLRLELKGDIKDVASQVSDLNKVVTENEIKQAVSSTKIGLLITGITILVSGVVTLVVDKVIGRPI